LGFGKIVAPIYTAQDKQFTLAPGAALSRRLLIGLSAKNAILIVEFAKAEL
jgi:multidrug efflux pump subunit AcrB